MTRKRVQIKALLYKDGKTVYGLSHVRVSESQVNPSV
jgi:hypothetical protein